MGSQINIRTGKEYADEELGLLKTQPILQNYEQLKVSETAQPILLESTVTCNEIEKAKVAEESVTDHNRLQAMDRNSNSRNISHLRKSRTSEKRRATSYGSECYHPKCSHQISHRSVPSNASVKQRNCQQCSDVYDNVKNGSCCGGMCKINSYNSGTTGATHTNEPVKNKEDEATQTSYSIYQKMTHCSKPIHQQVRPESNFIKANVYSCQKCICKGIREQSSRNRRCVRSSTVNAIKSHAWNQMLSASNHHRKAKCRHSIHIIGGPSHQNRPKHDVLKCYGCGRLTLRKCCNGRSIGVHHCSACHLHSNGKNHSSGFRHTYYRKHH
ncbi:hypothetical protein LOAG_00925 [Loa loa]|uniref:Uncharacterized protein n=1 Tax=Loa loa TaxID=7209 RepID=A0A1S0UAA7_LOALO|nr:hypothetical protein LOAG_00925 [Loa loa]EFO27561.2 hypothetical protein LOAG_00925 [Loa loa]